MVPFVSLTVTSWYLPPEFPGEWNYLECLQLSLRRSDGGSVAPDSYGVEVKAVTLELDGRLD
jgi:hypothetical protein